MKTKVRAVIRHEGKILLAYSKKAGFFMLPGGTLEETDASLKACLERELLEELGPKAEVGKCLAAREFRSGHSGLVLDFLFEVKNGADYLKCDPSKTSHGFEIDEWGFFDRSDFEASLRPFKPDNLFEMVEGPFPMIETME